MFQNARNAVSDALVPLYPPPQPPARDLSLGPPLRWIAPPRKMSWLRASDFEAYRAPQKNCLLTPFHSNDCKCRWVGLQKIS